MRTRKQMLIRAYRGTIAKRKQFFHDMKELDAIRDTAIKQIEKYGKFERGQVYMDMEFRRETATRERKLMETMYTQRSEQDNKQHQARMKYIKSDKIINKTLTVFYGMFILYILYQLLR